MTTAITSGHLFVVQGDLTKLACDAVLVPTAAEVEVTSPWRAVIAPHRVSPGRGSWWKVDAPRPDDWTRGSRTFRLPEQSLSRDVWLVQTGWDDATAEWVVDGLEQAVRAARAHLSGDLPRERPLIAFPLVGSGAGGLHARRGEVIAELVPRLQRTAEQIDADLVLVLADARDLAAVQGLPRSSGLDHRLERAADALARRVADGELVLFLGAGVSIAAGMPTWPELLTELASEAGFPDGALDGLPALDAAQVAERQMGPRFAEFMRGRFTAKRHALAHALLAGLRAEAVVTTNYDDGYEMASSALTEPPTVLPRERSSGGRPWLLKLHGDVARPGSIVLTRQQYLEHGDAAAPLTGMVQSLLLTRHMLFVGFSLIDDTFARLALQVRRVLQEAGEGQAPVGTVLQLLDDPVRKLLYAGELEHVSVAEADEGIAVAARRLELFLDRLLASASRLRGGSEQYLLDERYAGMPWSDGDRRLRELLLDLQRSADPDVRSSDGWTRVEALLTALGGR